MYHVVPLTRQTPMSFAFTFQSEGITRKTDWVAPYDGALDVNPYGGGHWRDNMAQVYREGGHILVNGDKAWNDKAYSVLRDVLMGQPFSSIKL